MFTTAGPHQNHVETTFWGVETTLWGVETTFWGVEKTTKNVYATRDHTRTTLKPFWDHFSRAPMGTRSCMNSVPLLGLDWWPHVTCSLEEAMPVLGWGW